MAKTSNKVTNESAIDPEVQKLLDEALKAEGASADQATEFVGLTPIYNPDTALSQKWPALVGYVDRIEILPEQRANTNDAWTPVMVRFIATQATKGVAGPKNNRQIVDIQPGEEIMLPISGSLGVNSKLEQVASDPVKAHLIIVAVTGHVPSPKGNDMWTFKVLEIAAKAKPRAGDPKLGYPLTFMNFSGAMFPNVAPPALGAGATNGATATHSS